MSNERKEGAVVSLHATIESTPEAREAISKGVREAMSAAPKTTGDLALDDLVYLKRRVLGLEELYAALTERVMRLENRR